MRERSLFVGVAVALYAAAAIVMAASSVPLAEAQGVVSPPADTGKNAGETESYWTPDRMRNAKPVPMPQPDGAKGRKVAPDERPAAAKPGRTQGVKPKTNGQ